MPRGTKKSANQHNKQHENGIVAPGRRITKPRSNSQPKDSSSTASASASASSAAVAAAQSVASAPTKDNTAASNSEESSTRANTPPLSAPSPATPSANQLSALPPSANGRLPHQCKPRSSSSFSQTQSGSPVSSGGDGKGEDTAAMAEGKKNTLDGGASRKHEAKAAAGQDTGVMQHISTIVSSRSLTDSLTVLVFLLSLPPWFHTVVNALFALATFVPPSGSFNSLPTLSDFVSSFSPTTPSFAVMLLIDSIASFLWQFFPMAFQAVLIDFAQAVVATTLGGGYSNKPGSPDNTLWCLGFATLSHFMTRYKRSIYRILHRTWIGRWTPPFDMIEERSLPQDYPVGYERGWFDTIQVFLALHIVCQGLTKMVRRSLYTSRLSTTSSVTGSGRDSEVANASATGVDVGEGSEHFRHGAQLRSKESLANLRDVNRDKISSGKRRRKQGNYTRSQQPLWAAFASTKATLAREYLAGDAKQDRNGTGAVDKDHLGDSPFESSRNKIWITRMQPNSLYFETGPMDPSRKRLQKKEKDEGGLDKTRPFYVRINGADWISTKMAPVPDTEVLGRTQWVGEIYGLSPTYSYQVHFIRSDDDSELHSEVVVTPPASMSDQSPIPAAPAHPLLPSSPRSPSATLKVSIAGCEASVEELLDRQKRLRRENKQTQSALRREIDSLNEKISKQAQSAQTLQSRQTRENQHIRQAEDAITTMAEELDAWKEIPEEEIDEYRHRKAEHESTRNEHRDAKSELVRSKDQNQRIVHSMQLDANKEEQKNARSQQRVHKLKSQHDRLVNPDAPASALPSAPGDAQRSNSGSSTTRAQQRAIKIQEWQNMVEGRERLLNHKLMEYNQKVRELQQYQQMDQQVQRPHTPSEDGELPGTIPQPPSTGNSRPFFDLVNQHMAPFGTPERTSTNLFDPFANSSALLHKTNSTGGHGKTKNHSSSFGNPRPRSTSIMSGNTVYQDVDEGSGGTDGTAFEQFPSVPFGFAGPSFKRRSGGIGLVREGSNGGSSGSGSPHVLGGITRPPAPFMPNSRERELAREPSRQNSWNAV